MTPQFAGTATTSRFPRARVAPISTTTRATRSSSCSSPRELDPAFGFAPQPLFRPALVPGRSHRSARQDQARAHSRRARRQAASSASAAALPNGSPPISARACAGTPSSRPGAIAAGDDGRRAEPGVSGGEDAGHDLAAHGGEIDPALAGDHGRARGQGSREADRVGDDVEPGHEPGSDCREPAAEAAGRARPRKLPHVDRPGWRGIARRAPRGALPAARSPPPRRPSEGRTAPARRGRGSSRRRRRAPRRRGATRRARRARRARRRPLPSRRRRR